MADDVLYKQVLAVIDERTTMVCLRAAGQIRRINEDFDTLMGDLPAPPFHIHCRSVVVPYMHGFVDTQKARANAEIQQRPSKDRAWGPSDRGQRRLPIPAPDYEGGVPTATPPLAAPKSYRGGTPVPAPSTWGTLTDPERLATETRAALASYVVDGGPVLAWGRSGRPLASAPPAIQAQVRRLDEAIAAAPALKKPVTVYHALTAPALVTGRTRANGLRFRVDSFVSGTVNRNVAGAAAAGDAVLLVIVVPAGSRVLRPASASGQDGFLHEREVLLPRGTVFEVVGDTMTTVAGRRVRTWQVIAGQ